MDARATDKRLLKTFGHRVRQLHEVKGWTLEEAEEHGYSSWRHLQRVESGKNVTLLTMARIAKLYDVSLSELLNDI